MKKAKNSLTQNRLKSVLKYDKETGLFAWIPGVKKRNIKHGYFPGCVNSRGYTVIMVDGFLHYCHRLAWLYEYGYLPEYGIDHINRNKADNKIENLREVSQSCNLKNKSRQSNNTSGVTGVCPCKNGSAWVAQIAVNRKPRNLGTYKTLYEAVEKRWEAEKELNWNGCCTKSDAYQYLKNNQKEA